MLAATYVEFEHVLRQARALPEPSEAHGTLAGALCSSRDYGLIEWLREILPDDSPDEAALRTSVNGTGLAEGRRPPLLGDRQDEGRVCLADSGACKVG
jgi:hypothetical protein